MINKLIEKAAAVEVGVPVPGGHGNQVTYWQYVCDLYRFSLRIGFALAVLMIVYAGIKYLTSQGDSGKLGDAKNIALGAILGFAILMLAYLLLSILGAQSCPA